jgi:hypothetical protein
MRLLLAIALLWPLAALAQITYTTTPGTGYQPLNGATIKGSVSVRTNNAAPPVQHTLDGVNIGPPENLVPIDLFGDLALWDTTKVSDGPHVIKAGAHTATFTVKNTQQEMRQWLLSWIPPTQNEDGSTLTDLTGFRVEAAPDAAGVWSNVWSGSTVTSEATVTAPGESACFRVFATSASAESDPSQVSCSRVDPTRPNAPIVVGDTPRALSLVAGTSSGTRAVYLRSAKGSRGTKVGDLRVGPVNGDFERIECDPADSFTYSNARYSKVTDVKAPEALRGVYVSGCYSVGTH